ALAIAALVYAIVWIPFALEQRHQAFLAGDWLSDTRSVAWVSTLLRVGTSVYRQVIADGLGYISHNPGTPWPYLPVLLLVIPPFLMRRRPPMLLWYVWVLGTIGFVAALDLARATTHLRFTRYIMLAAPGVFPLFCSLVMFAPAWISRGLLG